MMSERLDSLVNITSGYPLKSELFSDDTSLMPVIRIRDIDKGATATFTSEKLSDDRFIVRTGDMLIAMDGEFKIAVWKGPEAYLNQRVCKIEPKDERLKKNYLCYFLPKELKRIEDATPFVTVKHLSVKSINEISINLPSIETQQQIVAVLDKAQSIIVKRKASLQLLNQLLRDMFLDMFGDPVNNEKKWAKIKFKDAAKNENSKRVPVKQDDRDKREGIYPYYGATGVIDTIDDYKFDGEYLLIAEDGKNLLFRKKNNAFIARGKFWVNNHAHVLSENGICTLQYLEFFLNSIDFKPYISGIDQVKLNKENLDKISVPCPPLSLQNKFSQIVAKSELIKNSANESLVQSEILFQSLLQKAFKGELETQMSWDEYLKRGMPLLEDVQVLKPVKFKKKKQEKKQKTVQEQATPLKYVQQHNMGNFDVLGLKFNVFKLIEKQMGENWHFEKIINYITPKAKKIQKTLLSRDVEALVKEALFKAIDNFIKRELWEQPFTFQELREYLALINLKPDFVLLTKYVFNALERKPIFLKQVFMDDQVKKHSRIAYSLQEDARSTGFFPQKIYLLYN